MHNTCGKVRYGSTEDSQIAMKNRQQAGLGSDQNVAVYSVNLPNGKTAKLAFPNTVKGAHSEAHADNFLAELGIAPEDVTAIYSERNFCTSLRHMCAGRVAKYGNASLSWSFDKGENAWAGILNAVHGG